MHFMSSYHSSFQYLDKKSTDFGWIIAHFDPDNGETDSYLSQEQIYSESYNGTKRTLYGTKYTSVANVKITVIKQNGNDFTLQECRDAYRWLTGNPEADWMYLYIGNEVKYRLLCTIQDVKPQKLDARTVGLNIYCESLSPWAYSPLITLPYSISGSTTIEIDNESDDLYTPVYMKTVYVNTNGSSLVINNTSIGTDGEKTEISNLAVNEVVTLDNNMMITSNKPNKVFGNSFNFKWPRLKAGINKLDITGTGDIIFEYCHAIKMGDCATDINIVRDPICDENNNIQVDTLPWERISNKPTTISGYGLSSDIASKYYNKTEIDSKIANISVKNVYTKEEIDSMLEDFVSDDVYTKSEVDELIANIDISDIDTYSKSEIDAKLANITASGVDIDEEELNAILAEVLI